MTTATDPQQLVADLIEAKWTQAQIADRTGIAQGAISKILRAKKKRGVMHTTYLSLQALHSEVFPGGKPKAKARRRAPAAAEA